jgi:parallel beta-helix repeat protein
MRRLVRLWFSEVVVMRLIPGLVLVFFTLGLLLQPVYGAGGNVNAHTPIILQSDADFTTCACVISGDGTQANPYVIGPWAINGYSGAGVTVDGTSLTKSFVLLNLTIAGHGDSGSHGIVLRNINPAGTRSIVAQVKGAQTSINSAEVGIVVESSNYVTLDGGGANTNGAGISAAGAGTINKQISGSIDIENSSHILVTGWQLSASGLSIQPDWITLDPTTATWGVGGVRFFGVTSSTIDHIAVNNCTDASISLFNSSYNTVSNNTADYPFTMNFIVADGSSYNQVINNVASTGDFIGYLVADPLPGTWTLQQFGPSHDNQVIGNSSVADGPIGNEVHSGVVPAFTGGIVVLNGTYNNVLTNNDARSFVWAQAVPDNTSPIGVVHYPPTLYCNVSASEGGGGIPNYNGNAWTGNTAKIIAPCVPNK